MATVERYLDEQLLVVVDLVVQLLNVLVELVEV